MDFGEFTITKREILVCISITIVMIAMGFFISTAIENSVYESNEKYYKALKIENDVDMFDYALKTNVGYTFAQGRVQGIDPVEKDIKGKYFYIEKVKEEYTKHTRQVAKTRTKSDGTTETYYVTEEYWTWDYQGKEEFHVNKFTFLGKEFNYGAIHFSNTTYKETIKESSYIRYKYYVIPNEFDGSLFTKIKDNTITQNEFYYNTIKGVMKNVDNELNTSSGLFWFVWIVFIFGIGFFYVYMDNHYLEDKKKGE